LVEFCFVLGISIIPLVFEIIHMIWMFLYGKTQVYMGL
jgi:hypothetical protein